MIKVILVEDDRDLRELLSDELTLEGLSVTCVCTSSEFYKELAKKQYDVAVLDVGLPGQSGLEIARYVHQKMTMGIVLLTAYGAEEDRIAGYQSGADLYFVKPVDSCELIPAIKNLVLRLRSPAMLDAPSEEYDDSWTLNSQSWQLFCPKGDAIKLTTKEIQFLKSLAENNKKLVTRNDMINILGYSSDSIYSHKSMDVMITRLRNKIRKSLITEPPIKTVRAMGYVFTSPIIHIK